MNKKKIVSFQKLKLYGGGRLYKIRHISHSCCFDSEGQPNNERPLMENQ
jgi:hypothetical protein